MRKTLHSRLVEDRKPNGEDLGPRHQISITPDGLWLEFVSEEHTEPQGPINVSRYAWPLIAVAVAEVLNAYDDAVAICGVISASGAKGEPLACAYRPGHGGVHSWATLPTFIVCR